jgi:hypothetical protein
VFVLLGVHPGPEIDAYALAALADCPLTEARRHLGALYHDHLVQETAPGRYQLHDLVRDYAASRAGVMDRNDTAQAMRRVLQYYLYTATAADFHMPAYATPTTWITLRPPTYTPPLDTRQRAYRWLAAELTTLMARIEHVTSNPGLATALSTKPIASTTPHSPSPNTPMTALGRPLPSAISAPRTAGKASMTGRSKF